MDEDEDEPRWTDADWAGMREHLGLPQPGWHA